MKKTKNIDMRNAISKMGFVENGNFMFSQKHTYKKKKRYAIICEYVYEVWK